MSRLLERDILREPSFGIRFNGKELGEDMLKFVSEVVIEDEENALPLARITVIDTEGTWLTDKNVVRGTGIAIRLGHLRDVKHYKEAFNGRITHVEASFPQEGYATLTINCIDRAIRLMATRKPRSWKKKKVSDVIKAMMKAAELEAEVTDTKAVMESISQGEETDLEFITRWRKLLGWRFYKRKKSNGVYKYYFGPRPITGNASGTLGYKTGGMEIISFEPTYTEFEPNDSMSQKEIDNHKGLTETKKIGETNKGMLGETSVKNAGYTGGAYPTGKASS